MCSHLRGIILLHHNNFFLGLEEPQNAKIYIKKTVLPYKPIAYTNITLHEVVQYELKAYSVIKYSGHDFQLYHS